MYKLEMGDEHVESETTHLGNGSNFCINDLPSLDEVKRRVPFVFKPDGEDVVGTITG